MDKMYYLFSKKNLNEAIYICHNSKYIDNPTLQTGIYPMGMLLSFAIKVLTPWYHQDLKPSIAPKLLSQRNNLLLGENFSFSSNVNDDMVFSTAFNTMMVDYIQFSPSGEAEQRRKLLKSYMSYIFLCQDNQKFSSIDKIHLLISQNGNILPRQTLYTSGTTEEKQTLFAEEITELLSSSISSEGFTPSLKELPRAFSQISSIKTKKTIWSPLATPIYFFEINDIIDFILASLHCIFEQKYFLRKCSYCKDLIITNDRKRKYCPEIISSNDNNGCATKKDRERRKKDEAKDECKKIHHGIRSQLYTRIGAIASEEERKIRRKELDDFLEETAKIKDNDDLNKEGYIAWMENYWENVKEEGRNRRKNKSKK